MILKHSHNKIWFTKDGKLNKTCRHKLPTYEVKCDGCGKIFTEKSRVFEKRLSLIDKEYCGKCSRPLVCSLAGIKSNYDKDGNLTPNSGRFTSKQVTELTAEEYVVYCDQRKRASDIFHNKLNSDPALKKEHYKKVFKNSRIGYISKAQRDIAGLLKDDGFKLEQYVEGFMVDIVNFEKKLIIEYNGDLFHANPRIYNPDDYIGIIKMTAKEKWVKDRRRRFALRNKGWSVMVIWENEWINDRKRVFKKLKHLKDDDWSFPMWYEFETVKTKKMKNEKLNLNKYILLKDVDDYLKNGWEYGHISRRK